MTSSLLVVPNATRTHINNHIEHPFTLVLAVDDEFWAAYTDSAMTAPGPPPAGAVIGRSAQPGQPDSYGETPPAAPDVKTGSLPAKAGRPNSRPPQQFPNPPEAPGGPGKTTGSVSTAGASPR